MGTGVSCDALKWVTGVGVDGWRWWLRSILGLSFSSSEQIASICIVSAGFSDSI